MPNNAKILKYLTFSLRPCSGRRSNDVLRLHGLVRDVVGSIELRNDDDVFFWICDSDFCPESGQIQAPYKTRNQTELPRLHPDSYRGAFVLKILIKKYSNWFLYPIIQHWFFEFFSEQRKEDQERGVHSKANWKER